MLDPDLIPEPELALAIAAATGGSCPISYVAIANRRRSGAWPAEQHGTRWFVRRANLPGVLAALGLAAQPSAGSKASSKFETRTSHEGKLTPGKAARPRKAA